MGYIDSTGRYRRTFTDRILLPLNGFVQLAGPGTPLTATAATTVPGLYVDDTNEAAVIRWVANAAPGAIAQGCLLPADRQPGTPMYLKAQVSKTGATVGDATTFTATAVAYALGALRDSDTDFGGVTNAIVGNATSKTVQLVQLTLADADLPAPSFTVPSTLSLTLKPTAGLLGTDGIDLHNVWLEYTRVLLAE